MVESSSRKNSSEKPLVLFISGPTASGKSSFAIELAKKHGGEIINADSVQLYKGFDIGSGKVTAEEKAQVPHHLFDVFEPQDEIDVFQFSKLAEAKIEEVYTRGKLPIVIGGSGLYIRTLLCGLVEVEAGEKAAAKEELERVLAAAREKITEGELEDATDNEILYQHLSELDPKTAEALHPNDSARISRALMVALTSGESLTSLREGHQKY